MGQQQQQNGNKTPDEKIVLTAHIAVVISMSKALLFVCYGSLCFLEYCSK